MILDHKRVIIYILDDAFINAAKGKMGLFGYYFGIVLAFSGVLAEAATQTMSGSMLWGAEVASVVISIMGLGYSLWLLVKDKSLKAKEEVSPLITMIELAIGICGVVSSATKAIEVFGGY